MTLSLLGRRRATFEVHVDPVPPPSGASPVAQDRASDARAVTGSIDDRVEGHTHRAGQVNAGVVPPRALAENTPNTPNISFTFTGDIAASQADVVAWSVATWLSHHTQHSVPT